MTSLSFNIWIVLSIHFYYHVFNYYFNIFNVVGRNASIFTRKFGRGGKREKKGEGNGTKGGGKKTDQENIVKRENQKIAKREVYQPKFFFGSRVDPSFGTAFRRLDFILKIDELINIFLAYWLGRIQKKSNDSIVPRIFS